MAPDIENHPLRDKAVSRDLHRLAARAREEARIVKRLVMDAERNDATAHANLYNEVRAELRAAERSIETAARLMDPDLTDVADYEEELT